jgi:hypothetical protein
MKASVDEGFYLTRKSCANCRAKSGLSIKRQRAYDRASMAIAISH